MSIQNCEFFALPNPIVCCFFYSLFLSLPPPLSLSTLLSHVGTSQVSASPSYYTAAQQTAQAQAQQAQAQQAAAAAYYGYSASYRPQATSYAATTTQYYNQQGQRSQGQQQQQSAITTTVAGGVQSAGTTASQYGQLKKVATTTASSMVTYPAYTPTNYYAAYSKQAAQKVKICDVKSARLLVKLISALRLVLRPLLKH